MGKVATSALFNKVSGSVDDTVVASGRGGLSTRRKPRYRYPKNAAVGAGNARLAAANAVWNGLTWSQADAWNRYAAGLTRHNDLTGEPYHPTGKNALVGLASKVLQIDPSATVPPTGAFVPPDVTIAAGTSEQDPLPLGRGRGGVESVAEGMTTPTLPSPKGEESPVAKFTASGPTPSGVRVELLVQPLLNERRSPARFYKSRGFVSFVAGSPTYSLPLAAGWYATAYRFVESSTGRVGLTMPMGKFQVA